jgi:hypothetical protein
MSRECGFSINLREDIMENYVCPVCGGNLVYWNEYYFEKFQKINPNTGKLNKRIYETKPQEANCGDMHGLRCENEKCNWCINIINESNMLTNVFDEWFDKNKNDLRI